MTELDVPALTPELWRQLNAEGKTNTEIARITNRTPQAVSNMLSYYGLKMPQTRAQEMWPWDVQGQDLMHAAACEHLRRHSAWMTDGRNGMSLIRKRKLRSFYEMLQREKKVVEFNPDFPPIRGVSAAGGWKYQDRVPADEDLIIRVNTLVKADVDDEFLEFWSIPDRGEWPRIVGKYD